MLAEREGKLLAEESLRRSESRFFRAYSDAAVGMMMVGPDLRVFTVNQTACRITGLHDDLLRGMPLADLLDAADRDALRNGLADVLSGELESHRQEHRIARQDGTAVWVRTSASRIGRGGDLAHLFLILEDITAQTEARQKIEFQANHDELTGLPNRRAFHEALTEAIEQSGGSGTFAVLYIDLDGFKLVNDSLGHAYGDQLLRQAAPRLAACVGRNEILARTGGDEFTCILRMSRRSDGPDAPARRARALLEALSTPFRLSGDGENFELAISASIGICLYPRDGRDADELIRCADAAMYHAKRSGKRDFRFFTPELAAAASRRLRIEQQLRQSLASGGFEVHYQPLFDAARGRLLRFEALCRWRDASGQNVPPDSFIPIAEESGLIVPLGRWVLGEACRQARLWNNEVEPQNPVRVAVNVSLVQITQSGFVEDVRNALAISGLPPSLLELELTESTMMRDPEHAVRVMNALRALGVALALDDFGVGHSSFSQLQRIPLDVLKVDRSFVRQLHQSSRSGQMVAGIIGMAHGLGLEVVCEGVELPEQALRLRELGCDVFQGFLLSRPLTPESAMRLVSDTTMAGFDALPEWDTSMNALALTLGSIDEPVPADGNSQDESNERKTA